MGRDDKRGKSPADLSGEDLNLWRHVTRDAKPLREGTRLRKAPGSEVPPEPSPEVKPRRAAAKPLPAAKPVTVVTKRKPPVPELGHGTVAGVDRRQAERLRRGRLEVEARLDLHGHSQLEAHRALDAFLAGAVASGKRCVLVVTGRGIGKDAGGVLKREVPRWLNQPPNRARVLAFDRAQPKDGGDGALYVLLRRKRAD